MVQCNLTQLESDPTDEFAVPHSQEYPDKSRKLGFSNKQRFALYKDGNFLRKRQLGLSQIWFNSSLECIILNGYFCRRMPWYMKFSHIYKWTKWSALANWDISRKAEWSGIESGMKQINTMRT